jgi:hypothetical protein
MSGWGGVFGSSAHAVSDKESSNTTQGEGGDEERVLGEDIVKKRERRLLWEAAWCWIEEEGRFEGYVKRFGEGGMRGGRGKCGVS